MFLSRLLSHDGQILCLDECIVSRKRLKKSKIFVKLFHDSSSLEGIFILEFKGGFENKKLQMERVLEPN